MMSLYEEERVISGRDDGTHSEKNRILIIVAGLEDRSDN